MRALAPALLPSSHSTRCNEVATNFFLPPSSTGRRDTIDRWAQLLIGLAMYGLALALMVRAQVGVAPWDVLSFGLIEHLNISYGFATIAVSVIVLLLWIPLKQRFGIGTILNGITVGLWADLGLSLLPEISDLWLRILFFATGLVLLAFATVLYIGADFGPGPRDGLMTGLVRVTKWPVWLVRTLIEGSVLVIGWALIGWVFGTTVGIGTLVFAFGVGPLIQLFLPPLTRWRIARSAKLADPETGTQPA